MNRNLMLVGLAAATVAGCGPMAPMSNSYKGQAPPEVAAGGTWINSDSPLSLKELQGQVVWLEFSFLH